MDIVTFLSCAASVVAIITFGIEIYKIISTKKNNTTTSTSTGNIDNTVKVNLNTNDITNNINFDSHDKNIKIYKINPPISHHTNNNSDSYDFFGYVFIFIFIGFIVSKFFLDNSSSILLYLIILGILSFTVTLTCILILSKNKLITDLDLCIKTIKWLPLFIGIISIYRPRYYSNTLSTVAELIKSGTGYAAIFFTHPYDSMFFLFQILGIAIMAVVFILYMISAIRDTFISFKTKTPLKRIRWKDAVPYFALVFFIFILVNGSYVKFFNKLAELSSQLSSRLF
jgi:hypothetical protein